MVKIKFDKNNINDYNEDQLESFKSKEKSYIDSGNVLMESLLKIPFNNKEKVKQLLEQISLHKNNVILINNMLYELHIRKSDSIDGSMF